MTGTSRRGLLDWKAGLGIAISIAGLYWVFKGQDFGLIVSEVKQADPFYFSVATICATAVFWVRAWRWKSLLESVRPGTTFRSRFAATTIGFMGNNIFPARVGEFLRAVAISRTEKLPMVGCFTSIMLERMFDAFTVLGLLFLSMTMPLPALRGAEEHTNRALLIGLVMLVMLVLLLGFAIWPTRAVNFAERAVKPFPARVQRPIVDALEAFLKGANALRNPRLLARAGSWSIILWLVNGIGFWFAFKAFSLPFNLNAALFFQGLLVFGVAIPSGPGFFGVYEGWAKIVLIGMWSADETTSNAFAIAYHIAGYIPVTVIGLYYASRLGISAKQAADSEDVVEKAVELEPR
ncbi:MAG: lysylphosphatidylglycerol synthase transmembrane domain-containing protein [Longimicrobiales bacterium]